MFCDTDTKIAKMPGRNRGERSLQGRIALLDENLRLDQISLPIVQGLLTRVLSQGKMAGQTPILLLLAYLKTSYYFHSFAEPRHIGMVFMDLSRG